MKRARGQIVIALAVLISAMPVRRASAQTHASPPPLPIGHAACVAGSSEPCAVKSRRPAIAVTSLRDGGLELVARISANEIQHVSLQEDLAARVTGGHLTPDEAQWISSDLANFDGTAYSLPEYETLIRDLGFPSDAQFTRDDLRELVRAHLQMALGVGPVTAAYLSNQLGMEDVAIEASSEVVVVSETLSAQLEPAQSSGDSAVAAEPVNPNHN